MGAWTIPRAGRYSNPMSFDTDIAIVGGGLNGPALALALASAGLGVTIVDAQATAPRMQDGFDGRSYALALTSVRMLDGIGVWESVASHAQPMLEIKVTDGRAGEGPSPFFMHFDHAEIEEGPMGHMVEDRHLRRALMEAVAAADGSARLCVGADGRSSGTALRAGIKRTGWVYGQTALVCAVSHALPHNGIAHQFFMPPGPLAILPLTENRSSIVWSETAVNAARIHALPDAEYLDVLRPRFGDFLGEISLAGARYTYPLSLSLAHEMIAERVALAGDSAHGVHPIAGQGLNAGFRDIAALRTVICPA